MGDGALLRWACLPIVGMASLEVNARAARLQTGRTREVMPDDDQLAFNLSHPGAAREHARATGAAPDGSAQSIRPEDDRR